MPESLGVYISVPFCKAKCTFCNFASGVFGDGRMQRYVERLCGEIRGARAATERMGARLPECVDTVYFGGGTPSLLTAEMVKEVFAALRGEFEIAGEAETTLECAPGQLEEETLGEYLRWGVNRVSFGVQSFVDAESAAVGRLHTRAMCEEEIVRVRGAGVEDISLDLIGGLPHQTRESWRFSVERAIETGVPHVSVYMLEVDEESRLGKEMLAQGSRYGAAAVPAEDEAAEMYQLACGWLDGAGVRQYEISNFAREGRRSRHNLKYWRREPYVGFGLDAHSMLEGARGAVRFANTDDLDGYLGGGEFRVLGAREAVAPELVDEAAAFEESLFLGLRLNEGVRLGDLRGRFGDAMLDEVMGSLREVEEAGLLERDSEFVRLTAAGRMASNEVFSRLLVGRAAYI